MHRYVCARAVPCICACMRRVKLTSQGASRKRQNKLQFSSERPAMVRCLSGVSNAQRWATTTTPGHCCVPTRSAGPPKRILVTVRTRRTAHLMNVTSAPRRAMQRYSGENCPAHAHSGDACACVRVHAWSRCTFLHGNSVAFSLFTAPCVLPPTCHSSTVNRTLLIDACVFVSESIGIIGRISDNAEVEIRFYFLRHV
jgi:hypothetical protein